MRKFTVVLLVVGALSAGSAGAASASDTPGCFGAWTSNFAHNPITGDHGLGEGLVPWVQADGPFGTTALEVFKSVACG